MRLVKVLREKAFLDTLSGQVVQVMEAMRDVMYDLRELQVPQHHVGGIYKMSLEELQEWAEAGRKVDWLKYIGASLPIQPDEPFVPNRKATRWERFKNWVCNVLQRSC